MVIGDRITMTAEAVPRRSTLADLGDGEFTSNQVREPAL
jgi:hypothetical protein